MKKAIILMSVFIVFYLGAMFFAEKKYNYDWTPATPQQNTATNIKEYLTKEGLPTSLKDSALQDSVIEQGILPSENKNYLTQDFSENSAQQNTNEETLPNEEILSTQENNLEQATENQPQIEQQTLPAEPSKPAAQTEQEPQNIQNAQIAEQAKPLTLKEQLASKDLVDIETLPVKIFLDLRYATENNFTGKKLYKKAKCYLKKPAALALAKAAKAAQNAQEPFYFCAYDCYRPSSVQKILVNNATQEGFVSRVSNHSRGMAIDLGPCDENGEPLLTPTEFDTFSPLSAAYYQGDEIPQIAIKNRTALQKVMKDAGFKTISKEWWHFDYKDAKNEEILNIKF